MHRQSIMITPGWQWLLQTAAEYRTEEGWGEIRARNLCHHYSGSGPHFQRSSAQGVLCISAATVGEVVGPEMRGVDSQRSCIHHRALVANFGVCIPSKLFSAFRTLLFASRVRPPVSLRVRLALHLVMASATAAFPGCTSCFGGKAKPPECMDGHVFSWTWQLLSLTRLSDI